MKITFATKTQAAIWQHELTGQISDGMWENTSNTSWEMWCKADVEVGKEIGREGFYPRKDNFNFASRQLVEIVGDRMIAYARLSKHFDDPKLVYQLQSIFCGFGGEFRMNIISNIVRYKGQYWDNLRKVAAEVGYEKVKTALEDESYGMKELMNDLKAIKKTIRKAK